MNKRKACSSRSCLRNFFFVSNCSRTFANVTHKPLHIACDQLHLCVTFVHEKILVRVRSSSCSSRVRELVRFGSHVCPELNSTVGRTIDAVRIKDITKLQGREANSQSSD